MNELPYETKQLIIISISFFIGSIAQLMKIKSDGIVLEPPSRIWWTSLSAGLGAVLTVSSLHAFTDININLLITVSGVAGWVGASIIDRIVTPVTTLLDKGFKN